MAGLKAGVSEITPGVATHAELFHDTVRGGILGMGRRNDFGDVGIGPCRAKAGSGRFGGVALAPERASDRPAGLDERCTAHHRAARLIDPTDTGIADEGAV